MRWPIRNQILLPLVAIQIAVVSGVSGLAAWNALNRVERDVRVRFSELTATLQQSTYPLTLAVLQQLRGLSGAEFVVHDFQGNVEAATLPQSAVDSLKPLLHSSPGEAPRNWSTGSLPLPARVQGADYLGFRVPVRQPGRSSQVLVLYPDSLIRAARLDALQTPVLLGFLSLCLTTLAVVGVAHHIGRRIQQIERQVARVAQGDFQPILLQQQNDELRDLSASVNRMGVQLEQMTRQIRETERAQLVKQLAGGIAHQLRNSLTGARLALQLHLRRCPRTDDESVSVALRQLALIAEQIRGLVSLIRDEHRPRITGRCSELITEVVTLTQPMCEHRQIRLEVTAPEQDVLLHDMDQMRAALLNLIINAIEATTTGGLVEIRVRRHGEELIMDVCDDGPGIPDEEEVQRIFDPFRTTKADGMGLGLALVKQTAEDHQGSVCYLREGRRTIFRLTCRTDPPL